MSMLKLAFRTALPFYNSGDFEIDSLPETNEMEEILSEENEGSF